MSFEERPKTVPEMRGMPPIPTDRKKSYSAASYAAQYGMTLEDAAELLERFGKEAHPEIEREILAMLSRGPELKHRALMIEDEVALGEEEERMIARTLRGRGVAGLASDL